VPRGITIAAEDVREGLVAVLAIKIPQPQFQGQTKERLNNTEVTPLIDGIVRSALENALNANRTTGDVIASRSCWRRGRGAHHAPRPPRCSARAPSRIA